MKKSLNRLDLVLSYVWSKEKELTNKASSVDLFGL